MQTDKHIKKALFHLFMLSVFIFAPIKESSFAQTQPTPPAFPSSCTITYASAPQFLISSPHDDIITSYASFPNLPFGLIGGYWKGTFVGTTLPSSAYNSAQPFALLLDESTALPQFSFYQQGFGTTSQPGSGLDNRNKMANVEIGDAGHFHLIGHYIGVPSSIFGSGTPFLPNVFDLNPSSPASDPQNPLVSLATNLYITMHDAMGNYVTTKSIKATTSNSNALPRAIDSAIDANGNHYFLFEFFTPFNLEGTSYSPNPNQLKKTGVVSYDANGSFRWVRFVEDGAPSQGIVTSLNSVDVKNNIVYLAGQISSLGGSIPLSSQAVIALSPTVPSFNPYGGYSDGLVVLLDALTGTIIEASNFGGSGAETAYRIKASDTAFDFFVLGAVWAGNVEYSAVNYGVPSYQEQYNTQRTVIIKYGTSLSFAPPTVSNYGSLGQPNFSPRNMTLKIANNSAIVAGAYTGGGLGFPITGTFIGGGYDLDVFVLKYNSLTNSSCAFTHSNPLINEVADFDINSSGNISYVTSSFDGSSITYALGEFNLN